MTSELSKTADSNREFLDSYLEISIGHYYTLAKLLSSRISNELTEAERLSIGIEVAALATASLENLVTWYMALGRWKPREGRKLLPQILSGIHVEESDHLAALEHVKGMRTDEFCHSFGIPWKREDLRARRIDEANWRYMVDQARLNIGNVLENMSPSSIRTTRDWVTRYLSSPKHESLLGGLRRATFTTVRILTDAGGSGDMPSEGKLTIPTDQGLLD